MNFSLLACTISVLHMWTLRCFTCIRLFIILIELTKWSTSSLRVSPLHMPSSSIFCFDSFVCCAVVELCHIPRPTKNYGFVRRSTRVDFCSPDLPNLMTCASKLINIFSVKSLHNPDHVLHRPFRLSLPSLSDLVS